jgi:hypothetical protein
VSRVMPDWRDAQSFKSGLVAEGWLSPDTYCNHFGALEDFPAVYLFLLHRPYADGRPGFDRAIVAYVGMSRRVRTRIASHDMLPRIETPDAWVMRWFKPTPAKALRDTEGHYIGRFNPPWNIIGKTRGVVLQ